MKKAKGGMYRNRFMLAVFTSFIFSIFLFYFDSSPLLGCKNVVQSNNDYLHSVSKVSPRLNSSFIKDKQNKPVVQESVTHNAVEPVNLTVGGKKVIDEVKHDKSVENVRSHKNEPVLDPCSGKYIYVHNLPSKFNSDIIKQCQTISLVEDMCSYLSNGGFGPKVDNTDGVLTDKGWFNTHLYLVDVIFHNRMKQYKCLTNTSSSASAIYVPFYAGLDVFRYLWGFNTSMRDSTSHSVMKWLSSRPEWQVLGGRDHFLVSGRATWEHRRTTDEDSNWGNNLLLMPEARNMTVLLPAASPWHRNDFAIPYPSYFHPSTDDEVLQWQNRMREHKKKYLFCFAGNPRPKQVGSIRNHIIEQCKGSKEKCKLLGCGEREIKCHSASAVIELFQDSTFCLQPPGDDPTRRSTFDSILAGCIPVLFHPASAYVQYTWYLPQNYTKYSVYIPEEDVRNGTVNIESTLSRISDKDVRAMKEEVIKLIPKMMYAHPSARMKSTEDAIDIAIKAVIERVDKVRKGVSNVSYGEEKTWKYNLFGTTDEHEWDRFFTR